MQIMSLLGWFYSSSKLKPTPKLVTTEKMGDGGWKTKKIRAVQLIFGEHFSQLHFQELKSKEQ